jgi:hypothetical protein
VTYSACTIIGGLNRIIVTKRDAPRNLCVVMALTQPWTNPFSITLPQQWGIESAYETPASADCRTSGPSGSVDANGGTGTIALPPTPTPTVDIDVTLTFPPGDAGARPSEQLMATGVVAPIGCQ